MKRKYILLIVVFVLWGCGIDGSAKNTESEVCSGITSETNGGTSTEEILSETESATTATDTQNTQLSEEPVEPVTPAFQITLPEGAVLMGDVFESGDWVIRREGYVVTEEYPYEGRNETWTQAGWITLWEGDYWGEGSEPFIPWNHCEMGNYERISQGYIGEALFDVYGAMDIYTQNIPDDKSRAECWVLVFEDPNGMQETGIHSNWIFLSKKCFTKEEAREIAKTYVPAYTE